MYVSWRSLPRSAAKVTSVSQRKTNVLLLCISTATIDDPSKPRVSGQKFHAERTAASARASIISPHRQASLDAIQPSAAAGSPQSGRPAATIRLSVHGSGPLRYLSTTSLLICSDSLRYVLGARLCNARGSFVDASFGFALTALGPWNGRDGQSLTAASQPSYSIQ